MKHFSFSERARAAPVARVALMALCGLLAACSVDTPASVSSSGAGGNSGVTMREVVGDYCPPAQATKGNC